MNRMPVAERREQLIGAAITVASRDGIEAATVRAVAAEAGVSLGVVHYCFQDKSELMRAMAHKITAQNAPTDLREVALEQYRGQWSAAEAVLEEIARVARIDWAQPVPELARAIVAFVDGLSLSWLVDGDDDAARESMIRFGEFLLTRTVAHGAASSEA